MSYCSVVDIIFMSKKKNYYHSFFFGADKVQKSIQIWEWIHKEGNRNWFRMSVVLWWLALNCFHCHALFRFISRNILRYDKWARTCSMAWMLFLSFFFGYVVKPCTVHSFRLMCLFCFISLLLNCRRMHCIYSGLSFGDDFVYHLMWISCVHVFLCFELRCFFNWIVAFVSNFKTICESFLITSIDFLCNFRV